MLNREVLQILGEMHQININDYDVWNFGEVKDLILSIREGKTDFTEFALDADIKQAIGLEFLQKHPKVRTGSGYKRNQ